MGKRINATAYSPQYRALPHNGKNAAIFSTFSRFDIMAIMRLTLRCAMAFRAYWHARHAGGPPDPSCRKPEHLHIQCVKAEARLAAVSSRQYYVSATKGPVQRAMPIDHGAPPDG